MLAKSNNDGSEPAGFYTILFGKGNDNHHLGQESSVNKGIRGLSSLVQGVT
jgi:hypothetical protein